MGRKLATAGRPDSAPKAAESMACLLFVLLLAVAFWAGAVWIAESLIRLGAAPY
jgi:hypothetical protein